MTTLRPVTAHPRRGGALLSQWPRQRSEAPADAWAGRRVSWPLAEAAASGCQLRRPGLAPPRRRSVAGRRAAGPAGTHPRWPGVSVPLLTAAPSPIHCRAGERRREPAPGFQGPSRGAGGRHGDPGKADEGLRVSQVLSAAAAAVAASASSAAAAAAAGSAAATSASAAAAPAAARPGRGRGAAAPTVSAGPSRLPARRRPWGAASLQTRAPRRHRCPVACEPRPGPPPALAGGHSRP